MFFAEGRKRDGLDEIKSPRAFARLSPWFLVTFRFLCPKINHPERGTHLDQSVPGRLGFMRVETGVINRACQWPPDYARLLTGVAGSVNSARLSDTDPVRRVMAIMREATFRMNIAGLKPVFAMPIL